MTSFFSPSLAVLLLTPFLLSGCLIKDLQNQSATFAGLRDMHLGGYKGWWEPGIGSTTQKPGGRFFMDYDLRQANGSGSEMILGGGLLTWRVDGIEVHKPGKMGYGKFMRFIVLKGDFSISSKTGVTTCHRAMIFVTNFDTSPPWMAVHVIPDDLDLGDDPMKVKYAAHPASMYFHAVGNP